MRNQENSGKTMLREAARLVETSAQIADLATSLEKQAATSPLATDATKLVSTIKKSMKTIRRVMTSPAHAEIAAQLDETLRELGKAGAQGSAAQNNALLSKKLETIAGAVREAAVGHMIAGTQTVQELDKLLTQSETLVATSTAVGQDVDTIEIGIGNLLRGKDSESQKTLLNQLVTLRRNIVAGYCQVV